MTTPRILVVDDEEVVRDNVRWVMDRQGFLVVTAGSEGEASELLHATPFDIVVADMKMDQDESGIAILAVAKQIDASIEVIILTAYGNLQNAAKAMELGAYSYVEKNVPDVDVYQILMLKVKQALEQKKLQEEYRRLQAHIINSERQVTLGLLASAIAHEVSNPLTGVLGFTQFALESVPETEPVHRDLKMIEKNAVCCQRILRTILDFARPDTGEKMPLDVHDAVARVLTLLEKEALRNKISISRHLCQETPLVLATPNQISQVIMNLMINAMHAMPDGGQVDISTKTQNGSVVVNLRDSGKGIEPQHLPRIFEPFFTTKGKAQGTGLGLYICKDIVTKLNGDLRVESELGRGTCFTISLPLMV